MAPACVSSAIEDHFDVPASLDRRARLSQNIEHVGNLVSDVRVEPLDSRLQKLIKTQEQDGRFPLTDLLSDLTSKSLGDLKKLASEIKGAPEEIRETVLATTLAVLVLELCTNVLTESWGPAVSKAKAVLDMTAKNATLYGRPLADALEEVVSFESLFDRFWIQIMGRNFHENGPTKV